MWYCGALFPASRVPLGSQAYVCWIPLVILRFAEANQRAPELLAKRTAARVAQGD